PDVPLERQMADAIATSLRADPGSVLAFLPGAAEIRRTETFLKERVQDASTEIVPLFGALDAAVQDRAIAPAPKGTRKVVLAASIRGGPADRGGGAPGRDSRRGGGAALGPRQGAAASETGPRSAPGGRPAPRPPGPY